MEDGKRPNLDFPLAHDSALLFPYARGLSKSPRVGIPSACADHVRCGIDSAVTWVLVAVWPICGAVYPRCSSWFRRSARTYIIPARALGWTGRAGVALESPNSSRASGASDPSVTIRYAFS